MFEGMEHNYMSRGYLLPEGCKDLIDVLNLHRKEQSLNSYFLSKLPQQFPQPLYLKKPIKKKTAPPPLNREITISSQISLSELATLLGQKPFKIIADLMELGIFVSAKHLLDFETASQIATKYGFTLKKSG